MKYSLKEFNYVVNPGLRIVIRETGIVYRAAKHESRTPKPEIEQEVI